MKIQNIQVSTSFLTFPLMIFRRSGSKNYDLLNTKYPLFAKSLHFTFTPPELLSGGKNMSFSLILHLMIFRETFYLLLHPFTAFYSTFFCTKHTKYEKKIIFTFFVSHNRVEATAAVTLDTSVPGLVL